MAGAVMGSPLHDSGSKPMENSPVMEESVTNFFTLQNCDINGINGSSNGAESSKAKKKLEYAAVTENFPANNGLFGNSNASLIGGIHSIAFIIPSQSSAAGNSSKSQEWSGGPAMYSLNNPNQHIDGQEKRSEAYKFDLNPNKLSGLSSEPGLAQIPNTHVEKREPELYAQHPKALAGGLN